MRLLGDGVGVVVCVVFGGTGHCGGALLLPHLHRMSEVPVMAWSQGTSYFTSTSTLRGRNLHRKDVSLLICSVFGGFLP